MRNTCEEHVPLVWKSAGTRSDIMKKSSFKYRLLFASTTEIHRMERNKGGNAQYIIVRGELQSMELALNAVAVKASVPYSMVKMNE